MPSIGWDLLLALLPVVAILFLMKVRYGLALSVLNFALGAFMVWLTFWSIKLALTEGFSGVWVTLLGLAALWGLFYGSFWLSARRYRPEPVDSAQASIVHDETVSRLRRQGAEAIQTFRLRPRAKGVVVAFLDRERQTAAYYYDEPKVGLGQLDRSGLMADHPYAASGRGSGFLVSSLGTGAAFLVTTWEALGLFSLDEIRQIVHAPTWEEAWAIHRDALDLLGSEGIHADLVPDGSLDRLLVELHERDRHWLSRFPIGLVSGFFRPLLHLGSLRRRPGRAWQVARLKRARPGSVQI